MALIGMKTEGFADSDFNSWISKDITLSTVPTSLKVGTDILSGRRALYIINDSSDMIFVGTNADLTVANSQITVQSGQEFTFNFGKDNNMLVYAVLEEGTNFVKIIEMK